MLKKLFNKKIIITTLIVLVVTVFWYFILKNNTFERKIGKWIDKNCVNIKNECILRINNLTSFDWDEMYVFRYDAGDKNIEEIIGAKLNKLNSGKRKIIFIKNGMVVYYEELPYNIENLVNNEVIFDIPDDEDYVKYVPETAIFNASKKDGSWGRYYDLKKIK